MEWYDCPACKGRHPWRPGEKACPTAIKTLERYDTDVTPTGEMYRKPPNPKLDPIEVTDSLKQWAGRKGISPVPTVEKTTSNSASLPAATSASVVAGSSERAEKYKEYMRNYMKGYRRGVRLRDG